MNLTDRINALPTTNAGDAIRKVQVLDVVKDAVTVAVDPSIHTRTPDAGGQAIVWAYLDTAYNLLREAAVRLTIQDMRDSAAELGLPFPATDDEVFKSMAVQGEKFDIEPPKTYLDLATHSDEVVTALDLSFKVLVQQVRDEALEAATFLATSDDIANLPEVEL